MRGIQVAYRQAWMDINVLVEILEAITGPLGRSGPNICHDMFDVHQTSPVDGAIRSGTQAGLDEAKCAPDVVN